MHGKSSDASVRVLVDRRQELLQEIRLQALVRSMIRFRRLSHRLGRWVMRLLADIGVSLGGMQCSLSKADDFLVSV